MAQNKFTKIVATVSDRRCDADFIKKLYDNGLNVVRMNSAHLQREGFQRIIDNVRQVSDRIGILMDTKGPEIRTTTNADDANLNFSAGDTTVFVGNPDQLSTKGRICLSYANIANDVRTGMHLLVDDGELDFRIPYTQSLEAFTAARLHGIDARLVEFEDEDHQVMKPQNSVVWNREFFGWLDKYLKK